MIPRNSKQDGKYFYVWESSVTCAFYRGSIGDMGKHANANCGLQVNVHSNLKNLQGQKLRRDMKIHGELVTFNFHFPKIQDVINCIVFLGLVKMSMTPPNPLFFMLGDTKLFKIIKEQLYAFLGQ